MRLSDPENPLYDEIRDRSGSHRGITEKDKIYNLLFGPISQKPPSSRKNPLSAFHEFLNPPSRPKSYSDLPLPSPVTDLLSAELPDSIPMIGGSPIGDFIPILSEVPAEQDRASIATRPRISIADYASLPAEVVSLVAPIRVSPSDLSRREAWKGAKRHRPYYHGVKSGNPEDVQDILKNKFTRGRSQELKLPGTSLSEDPLYSYEAFTNPERYHSERMSDVLAVKVNQPPSEIHHLSPEKYIRGEVPSTSGGTVYKKPNAFFKEAETFGVRDDFDNILPPFEPSELPPNRARYLNEQVRSLDDFHSTLVSIHNRNYYAQRDFSDYSMSLNSDNPLPFPDLDFKPEVIEVAKAVRDLRSNKAIIHDVIHKIPDTMDSRYFWESLGKMAGREKALELANLKRDIDKFNQIVDSYPDSITSEMYREYIKNKNQFVEEFAKLAPIKAPRRKIQFPDSIPE